MDLDPLIKMAIIHYQFESIHPFYDGNGRTGRIINILYLVQKGLLTLPILYLSSYIIAHKNDYYRLLQEIRVKEQKSQIRALAPKLYSQDLLNSLFKYPYTKIEYLQKDLRVSRNTAIRYLDDLVSANILVKHKIGRENYYEHVKLFNLLSGRKNA
jgi:Fic family protein